MKKVIDTYRGFKILIDSKPVDCKIVDPDGKVLNKEIPYYGVSIGGRKKYYTGCSGCYSSENDTKGAIEYSKRDIDRIIESTHNAQLERIQKHRNSKHVEYVLDNVTINVLIYGDQTKIYVNERPLRYASLPENFTLNDVLFEIHLRTIANYNVSDFKDVAVNYYKHKESVKVSKSILPIYSLLGELIEIKDEQFYLTDIRRYDYDGEKFIKLIGRGVEILVSVDELETVKLFKANKSSMESLSGLMRKMQFLE